MWDSQSETTNMVSEIFEQQLGLPPGAVVQCNGQFGLNISFCTFTALADSFTVIAYNGRGQSITEILRIPVGMGHFTVTETGTTNELVSQYVPLTNVDYSLPLMYLLFPEMENKTKIDQYTNKASGILTFASVIPAVGYQTFTVTKNQVQSNPIAEPASTKMRATTGIVTIRNMYYEVTFDTTTGTMAFVKNLLSNVTANISIDIGFYNSSKGGIYIYIYIYIYVCMYVYIVYSIYYICYVYNM